MESDLWTRNLARDETARKTREVLDDKEASGACVRMAVCVYLFILQLEE